MTMLKGTGRVTTPNPTDSREHSLEVLRRLKRAGYEALWAGGCVRDLLLGVPPKDYDVATSARPNEVRALFPRSIEVGAQFGVIRILGPSGFDVEVATFRSDGGYSDGRRPDRVHFSSPVEDAQRRDFTINGMFLDPLEGDRVIDYVGGQKDLDRRVVRAIGDPARRFSEDKLRLLRAARFTASLDFHLDEQTRSFAREMAPSLVVVSGERIHRELELMLTPTTRRRGFDELVDLRLLPVIFPDLASLDHDPEARERTRRTLDETRRTISFPLALALLCVSLDDANASSAMRTMTAFLKCSNEERDLSEWLIKHRRRLLRDARLSTRKRLLSRAGAEDLLSLTAAMEVAESGRSSQSEQLLEWYGRTSRSELDPPPLVTGDDLIALGLTPGPSFKQLLDQIRDEQLECRIDSRDAALARARELTRLH